MKMKNDCQVDYIKEAFDKLYNCVMPFIDLTQFADDANTAFKELDKKVHSEIYILKKRLAESDRAVDAGLTRSEVLQERISDLEQRLNNECKHGEEVADVNCQLASENADLKARLTLWEHSRITWRGRAQHAEKAITDLNKKISELEEELAQARNSTEPHLMEENDRLREIVNTLEKEINDLEKKIRHLEIENANLRVTPADANAVEVLKRENRVLRCDNKKLAAACEDNKRLREIIDGKEKEINSLKKKIHELEQETADDAIRIKSLKKSNSILRGDNETLWSRLEEADLDISKRPWHGDGNAMTDEQASYKSLVEAIEFQGKRIEELEAEKARLKEAYDIHETTIKKHKENVDLSYGHEFEFGDEVFVPWSDAPYMYVKTGLLYNTRTKRLVYVAKDRHLKWFGEKFAIV